MPALQVKDYPQELYEKLKVRAKRDNRSLTQEMIAIIDWYLSLPDQVIEYWENPTVIPIPGAYEPASAMCSPYEEQYDPSQLERRRALLERIKKNACYVPAGDSKTALDLLAESRQEAR